MEKVWEIGDKVFVVNDENLKAAEGIICDIEYHEGVGDVDGANAYYIDGIDSYEEQNSHLGPFWGCDLMTEAEFEALSNQPLMLQTVTATRCSDGSIWVTSDLDPNGMEFQFDTVTAEKDEKQFLCAVAEFLGFDADEVIHFKED